MALKAIAAIRELIDQRPSYYDQDNVDGLTKNEFMARYAAMRAETELLYALRVRFIPEADICLPCGLSRGLTIPLSPWENFHECLDSCHKCRAEAFKALDKLVEGVTNDEVEEPFMDPISVADRNAYFRSLNDSKTMENREYARRRHEERLAGLDPMNRLSRKRARLPFSSEDFEELFSEEKQRATWIKSRLAASRVKLAAPTLRNLRSAAERGREKRGELEIVVDKYGQVSRREGKGHVEYLVESLCKERL